MRGVVLCRRVQDFCLFLNHCYFGSGRIARRERAIWRDVRFFNGIRQQGLKYRLIMFIGEHGQY
jgi:hypothetical protein